MGYAWRMEAVSASEKYAALMVRVKHIPDETAPEAMYRALGEVPPQRLTYKARSAVTIPVDRAPPLVLTGFISSPCTRERPFLACRSHMGWLGKMPFRPSPPKEHNEKSLRIS
jgi:hypothetical protein